jgi:uncharacterized protein YdeI (YjbR/CyaY-like superfamily)
MNVSGISNSADALASMATNMKGADVSLQINVAVMKQLMDQQEMVAQGLIEMIQATPLPEGVGTSINLSA